LTQPFIADHLDPGLPGDTNALALRINLAQQGQWKINVDTLLGLMSVGKVSGDILTTLSTLSNVFDIFGVWTLSRLLAHKLVVPVGWHAKP